MRKSVTSKAKIIKEKTTLTVTRSDIVGWLRSRGEIPKEASEIIVTLADGDMPEITDDDCVEVRFTVETADSTGF